MDLNQIESEIKQHQMNSFLILSSQESIHQDYLAMLNFLNVKEKMKGLAINFRNPSLVDKEFLKNQGADVSRLFFIDCITVSADLLPDDKDIFFLMNQKDLSGIKSGIDYFFAKQKELNFIIIDLLDVLLYYNSIVKIREMLQSVKAIVNEKRCLFIALINKENHTLQDYSKEYFDLIV